MNHEALTRRRALGLIAAGSLVAWGCGSNDDESGSAATTTTGTDSGTDAASTTTTGDSSTTAEASTDASTEAGACTETLEGEIGPYFSDDSNVLFNRSNIIANIDGTNVQTGTPLTLVVTVLDTENACAPYVNAQIDIWHCNSAGIYSDQAAENTTTESYLRGYQLTDTAGQVTFTTVIPGWYAGRTTHIHLRIRSSYSEASSTSDGTNTTQLFFDQTLVDRLATTVTPYSAEGTNSTTNASDHVYSGETMGTNLLSLTGDDTNGYTATVTIMLPIAAATTTTTGGGGGGGGPGGGP